MIKKLDKLILKSFLGPFIATFFIAFFVLFMQGLWKYIDDLVGKGLDFITIGKFLWYTSASLLTLAMPIAILISSIMTFGNLGESFELVAIKSSGISLLRFMRPLMWVAVLLCGITFLFANYVIPTATLKFVTLYNDIYYKKPAFDLKEGVFFTYIPNYAIKVGKKDADNKTIHNVIIYEQTNNIQDNCIVAETGVMETSADKKFLEFNLSNGFRYQEKGNSGTDSANEFIRLGFKEFKKLFDMSSLELKKNSDSFYRKNYKMLSVRQLNIALDSIKKNDDSLFKKIENELVLNLPSINVSDSIWNKTAALKTKPLQLDSLIPDSSRFLIYDAAMNKANSIKNIYQFSGSQVESNYTDIKFHKLEWQRKFSISLACLVLFFIGAPLGSIIRKGGLGMPLVVAIVFFLQFHLLNMFGEKFVKEEITSPFLGMWLAVIVLVPVGIFLTYKAMNDSQLFSKEYYYRTYKKIRQIFSTFRKAKKIPTT
jgi:lipopolysaccharide export system permease protein